MDVPEIAAAGLKGDVEDADALRGDGLQIACAGEPLVEIHILGTNGEGSALLKGFLAGRGLILAPDLHGQTEDGPALGPAGVHGDVRDDRRDLTLADTVVLCVLQMVLQRTVGDSGGHQCRDSQDAFQFCRDGLLIPDLSEEHVIIQMREHRCDVAQLIAARGLHDFFILLSHSCPPSLNRMLIVRP